MVSANLKVLEIVEIINSFMIFKKPSGIECLEISRIYLINEPLTQLNFLSSIIFLYTNGKNMGDMKYLISYCLGAIKIHFRNPRPRILTKIFHLLSQVRRVHFLLLDFEYWSECGVFVFEEERFGKIRQIIFLGIEGATSEASLQPAYVCFQTPKRPFLYILQRKVSQNLIFHFQYFRKQAHPEIGLQGKKLLYPNPILINPIECGQAPHFLPRIERSLSSKPAFVQGEWNRKDNDALERLQEAHSVGDGVELASLWCSNY